MANKLTKEELIIRAVELGKQSTFGLTGVKIELEALFNRRDIPIPYVECERCEGDGHYDHASCNGDGCDGCNFNGYMNCYKCRWQRTDWRNEDFCHQWILRELAKSGSGLAKYDRGTRKYVEQAPLVYSDFMYDISVDSELTATISLENPQNIFLLPKLIEVWNKLGEAIGHGVNVQNAGMHMSLINDPECYYPSRQVADERSRQFSNFEKSMRLLLPALFFLGSTDEHSRSTHFREPQVSEDKFSAIHYYGGALEFRVFETCYDKPEQVLNNFVVMRNCIRFWTNEYRSPQLEKISPNLAFGNDNGETISRFYTTNKHIDILNAGLRKIKPIYLTLKELKAQRNFTVSKNSLNKQLTKKRKEAEISYKEYASRFDWRLEIDKLTHQASLMSHRNYAEASAEIIAEAAQAAERWAEDVKNRDRMTLKQYIKEAVDQYIQEQQGYWTLRAARS